MYAKGIAGGSSSRSSSEIRGGARRLHRNVTRRSPIASAHRHGEHRKVLARRQGRADIRVRLPSSGPADIYALGVPRDAVVVDRRRPKRSGENDVKELLAAYAKARQKSMPPYTAVVLVSGRPDAPFSDVVMAFQVQDDGGSRHITQTDQDRLMELRQRIWSKDLRLPNGVDPATWWKQEVAKLPFAPLAGVSDSSFRPDGAGDFLPGDGIPSPNDDRQFSMNRHPTLGPAGTILLRIRVDWGAVSTTSLTGSPLNAATSFFAAK